MSNPTVSITNSLAFELDVYDQYSDSDGVITYTKLGTVPASGSADIITIHAASVLGVVRTGIISAFSSTEYYVDFPVSGISVSILDTSFDYTISDSDQKGMEQALQFFQYISANPLGTTATNFETLINNETATTLETDVNAYFAALSSYGDCTLTAWTDVNLWLNREFSPWQEATYYLYTTTGTISEKATASISIASNGTATATLTDKSSGNQTDLAISDGTITEATVGSGSVSVSLTPTYSYVDSSISPTLTGTVNGSSVVGTKKKQDTSSSSSSTGFSDSAIVSIAIGGAFLFYTLAKDFKEYVSKKCEASNDAEVSDAQAELNDNLSSLSESVDSLTGQITELKATIETQRINDVNSELDAQTELVEESMDLAGSSSAEINAQVEEIARMREDASSVTNEELSANRTSIESTLEQLEEDAGAEVSQDIVDSEHEAAEEESEEEELEEEESVSDDGSGTDAEDTTDTTEAEL